MSLGQEQEYSPLDVSQFALTPHGSVKQISVCNNEIKKLYGNLFDNGAN